MDQTSINELILFLKKSLEENGINVESIVLFGSALSGYMDNDSDIDLAIISSDFENLDIFERAKLTMIPETLTQKKFKIPMDILNISNEEFKNSNFKEFYKHKVVA